MSSDANGSVPSSSSHNDKGPSDHPRQKRRATTSESPILAKQGRLDYGQPAIVIDRVEDATNEPGDDGEQPETSAPSLCPAGHEVVEFDQDSIAITSISRRNSESLGSIICNLRVSYFRFNPPGEVIEIFNRLVAPGESEDIVGEAARLMRKHLEDTCAQELLDKDLLFRGGSAAFDCSKGKETREFMSPSDWAIIRADIADLGYPHVHVHVDVHCDFMTLRNCPEGKRSFAGTKMFEIYKLTRMASNGQQYYHRRDLELIASRESIRKVVEEDKSQFVSGADTDQLVSSVFKDARILFAMCVYVRLSMVCLKALIDRGIDDGKLPMDEDHICHPDCGREFIDDLLKRQGSFRAAEFNQLGEHQHFDPQVVIPLHYHPNSPEEGSLLQQDQPSVERQSGTDRDRSRCGYGSFSEVFRVKIDEDQHKLSEDKSVAFAVKEFNHHPLRKGNSFERELNMLKQLREYSHPHIVTHLATWTQNDRYFMLFPFATCNLWTYMARWTFDPACRAPTLWLLEQLRGVADGLQKIHNLSGEGGLGATQLAVPSIDASKVSGWHHDLKPENFLFFSTQTTPRPKQTAGEGRICIADFGSGKVNTFRQVSASTRSANGTPDYEGPDRKMEGVTSRPSDIWSLGCVFLELLVWALFGWEAVREFCTDRHGRRNRDPDNLEQASEDSAFWQITKETGVELRQAVHSMFKKLQATITKRNLKPFDRVLQLVKSMLITERQARVNAVHVRNALHSIYTTAEINFTDVATGELETLTPQLSLDAIAACTPSLQLDDTTASVTTSPFELDLPIPPTQDQQST